MHNTELILTLTGGFAAALLFGYVTHRLGLSPIVGYLIAGVLVGPYTPGFVADRVLAEQLAEIGVVLLMFGVGLHFHVKDLIAVRNVAITGAVVQSLVATALGAFVVHMFGWDWNAGVVFGLALSVASTVVLTRVLADHGSLQTAIGRISVGWLVVEDIFTVFVLVLLPVVFGKQAAGSGQSIGVAVGLATLKLGIFAWLTLSVGGRLIPRFLNRIAHTRSRELFTLAILVLALGIAVASAYTFSVSMALGAFLAGMVVGQSDFSARAGSEALPMRDAFAVLFFLSVGMLFDPGALLRSPMLTLVTLGVVVVGKPVGAFVIVTAMGYGTRIAFGVALALAQIGEFSFMLASLGIQLGVLPEGAMNPLVAASILSITMNPVLYRTVAGTEELLKRVAPVWKMLNYRPPALLDNPAPETVAARALVVGFGPIGRRLIHLLHERGIEPTVVEMNLDTLQKIRLMGYRAVYGDARQREVLVEAGVEKAQTLILSASGSFDALEAIRIAREANPHIYVVARADYLNQTEPMRKAGADEVFSGEGEVALAMMDSVLRKVGATPEQLDEERERARKVFSQDRNHEAVH